MTKLTGVGFVLSVGHNSPEGKAHGHSYDVTVWFRFGYDARALQRNVDTVRLTLDHTVLDDDIRFAENIAEHIGKQLPGCLAVDCNRPLERIYARWEA
jgi:6-pyruvoyl-tetrahydropterin synthase